MTETSSGDYHVPVLGEKIIGVLRPRSDGTYVDCTIGGGGHTDLLLSFLGTNGRIIGIDRDMDAIQESRKRFKNRANVLLKHARFGNLKSVLSSMGITRVDGFVFDLGVSSHQLNTPERGLSYRESGPLDMRMDRSVGAPLSELLARRRPAEIARVLQEYGDVFAPIRMAKRIAAARPSTTDGLKSCVEDAFEKKVSPSLLSKIYMAFRIWVNEELEELAKGLAQALGLCCVNGVIVAISYHSGEDRIVKNWMRRSSKGCQCPEEALVCVCHGTKRGTLLTKKPILPDREECRINKRARSARLRALRKL